MNERKDWEKRTFLLDSTASESSSAVFSLFAFGPAPIAFIILPKPPASTLMLLKPPSSSLLTLRARRT